MHTGTGTLAVMLIHDPRNENFFNFKNTPGVRNGEAAFVRAGLCA